MAYPANTDYPGSVDAPVEHRVDNVDVVWDDDFNFQAKQHEAVQKHVGPSGGVIGDIIPGDGISGVVSAVASGGVALRMLARASFAAGTLWSLEDDYDVAAQQKMRVNYAGRLWTADGADFSSSEYLEIPHGNVLPVTFEEGRLFRKDDTDELYHADGLAWTAVGSGVSGVVMSIETGRFDATPLVAPPGPEEVVGQFMFDASKAPGNVKLRCMMNPTFAAAGGCNVHVDDIGAPGAPAAPTRITGSGVSTFKLEALSSGQDYHETANLTLVGGPAEGTLVAGPRMYEVILVIGAGTAGDTVDLGFAGLYVEV